MNSPVKILLADDSTTMHRAVSLGLKKEPYELICCDNGQDALRLVEEHKPQILLADLDMPGMTGAELTKRVKEHPELKNFTKVILLCGSFDQIDENHIDQIPSDARLWKTFESHVLISMIQTFLKDSPKVSQDPTLVDARPIQSEAKSVDEILSQKPTEDTSEKTVELPSDNQKIEKIVERTTEKNTDKTSERTIEKTEEIDNLELSPPQPVLSLIHI